MTGHLGRQNGQGAGTGRRGDLLEGPPAASPLHFGPGLGLAFSPALHPGRIVPSPHCIFQVLPRPLRVSRALGRPEGGVGELRTSSTFLEIVQRSLFFLDVLFHALPPAQLHSTPAVLKLHPSISWRACSSADSGAPSLPAFLICRTERRPRNVQL